LSYRPARLDIDLIDLKVYKYGLCRQQLVDKYVLTDDVTDFSSI
jgi:hypothetical protein